MPAVQQSAPKWELMLNLDLNERDEEHKKLYILMKNEAVNVYDELLKGRRSALKPQFRQAPEPWSNNQFLDSALRNAIATIVARASNLTRPLYARASLAGDNWVAKWMLYHVCRYRDGRNLRARSIADFHADDMLFQAGIASGTTTASSSSSSSPSQSMARAPAATGYYDAARNSYRPTLAARNV